MAWYEIVSTPAKKLHWFPCDDEVIHQNEERALCNTFIGHGETLSKPKKPIPKLICKNCIKKVMDKDFEEFAKSLLLK